MRPSWDYPTTDKQEPVVADKSLTSYIPEELMKKLMQTVETLPGKAYDTTTTYLADASAGYAHQLLNAAIAARLLKK